MSALSTRRAAGALTLLAAALVAMRCERAEPPSQAVAAAAPKPAAAVAAAQAGQTPKPAAAPRIPETSNGPAWERLAHQLEGENALLVRERDYWKGEAERLHAGLTEVIQEVNRRAAAARIAELHAAILAASATPPPPPSQARVWAAEATVQIVYDQAFVNGYVYNFGTDEAVGTLEVDFLLDGRVIATDRQPLRAPAGTTLTYSARFRTVGEGRGTYSAMARPVINR